MTKDNDPSTTNRTEVVKSYISPNTLDDLDREADRREMSRSALIDRYIRQGLRQDREDDVLAEARAVTELQDVIDQGLDDFRDVSRDIQDINAKTGVYAVAAFELIKRDVPDSTVQEALRTGSQRLRDDDLSNVDELSDRTSTSDDLEDNSESGGFWDE